ncbi:hypothetical protein B0T11DRAFT_330504 [Plectosphaerella cucumerina]|uniref:NmrA-like domain-containing protein n=1 Tax=Plectosphaerella cucumerina TaxID=40658 RepID=A0A8K0X204_9PEZI|nr:hypothetical protein B0T11DRAFT_330504 [Plectosphaerella cucumerina]
MSTKIVTIFGSTGQQGGSVARALLRDQSGTFKVRGITRKPDSDAAKALAEAGVEVVQADGLNKDSLVAAFKSTWAVFANINSDDPCINEKDGPTEEDMGKIIVDAAVKAGAEVFIFSGMASASETTNGTVPAKAFDEKHAVGQYARSKPFRSVVDVSPGWYMESFLWAEIMGVFGGWPHTPDADGNLTFTCPRWGGPADEVPFIAMEADYGDLVHGVLLAPEAYAGRLVQGFSQSRSLEKVIPDYERVTGKKARFDFMKSWEEIETYGMTALITVQQMFAFCQYSGGRYYGVPNDTTLPVKLKAAAAAAQGKSGEDAQLMTLERFFKQHFA